MSIVDGLLADWELTVVSNCTRSAHKASILKDRRVQRGGRVMMWLIFHARVPEMVQITTPVWNGNIFIASNLAIKSFTRS